MRKEEYSNNKVLIFLFSRTYFVNSGIDKASSGKGIGWSNCAKFGLQSSKSDLEKNESTTDGEMTNHIFLQKIVINEHCLNMDMETNMVSITAR